MLSNQILRLVHGSPGSITVVGEGEGPHPEPLEGPQHAQARPDAVAALHRDEARNLASLVGVNNLWKKDERCYREIGSPSLVTHTLGSSLYLSGTGFVAT